MRRSRPAVAGWLAVALSAAVATSVASHPGGPSAQGDRDASHSGRRRLAELVVIFPTNVWEYYVLDYFPFDLAVRRRSRARPVPRR